MCFEKLEYDKIIYIPTRGKEHPVPDFHVLRRLSAEHCVSNKSKLKTRDPKKLSVRFYVVSMIFLVECMFHLFSSRYLII